MGKHLKAISIASMALVATGSIVWSIWYLKERRVVTTDDCRVEASIVFVGSKLSDRALHVYVQEGDIVRKGQLLVELDSRSISARKLAAASKVALMKARYDEMLSGSRPHEIESQRARKAQATATLERARRDYERIEQLVKDDAGISIADRDAVRANYLAAEAAQKAEEENLALKLEGYREEEKRSAKAQWESAQAELYELEVLSEECVIKSPVDGMVAQKLVKPGELVNVGQKLFSIVDNHDIWLNVRVEETKIGKVKLGQEVKFSLDGYSGQEFQGKIYEIGATTCATFSLISTENVSGYFTKVMQRIPVKVSLPIDRVSVVFRPGLQGKVSIDF